MLRWKNAASVRDTATVRRLCTDSTSASAPTDRVQESGGAAVTRRFLQVAQPYFLPSEGDGDEGKQWLGLLAALLVAVVCGTLFAAVGLGLLLKVLVPSIVSEEAASALASVTNPQVLGVTAAGLGVAIAVAWPSRGKLAGRERQWFLLAVLLFLLFCVTGLNVLLSYVFRVIDNVLISKDAAAFYTQLTTFTGVLVAAVPIIGSYRWVRLTLAREWRSFLTRFFLGKYMSHRAFYELDSNSIGAAGIDNPDQRVTEDIDSFTRETLDFLLDVLDSVLNLFSFASILWVTSQSLTLSLVVYAFAGTAIALAAGSELVRLNAAQLRREADLRYSLVHVRDNAEAIAFYGGELRELQGVEARLNTLLSNLSSLINWTTGLGIYQQAFFYLARLVPYLVIGGLYLKGEVDFGTLGQATFAFSMVLSSVTLIVSRITDISRFSAGVGRLGTFLDALDAPRNANNTSRIATALSSDGSVELRAVSVETPDGRRPLVQSLDLLVGKPGSPSRVLVVGASGVGKSSVLRTMAGLWTQGQGTVTRPPVGEAMFLPQRPYMPLGSLRTQLLYPGGVSEEQSGDSNEAAVRSLGDAGSTWSGEVPDDAELLMVLASLGLGELPTRFEDGLDTVSDWARTLSLGEQQRVAAARCFLRKPRLLVLDEATSALPVDDEKRLYNRFAEMGACYVSVGHRASLAAHHDAVLQLRGGGKWNLMDAAQYATAAAATS